MKLHWSPKSPYVRKVMVVAHETGIAPKLELIRSVAAMLKPNERLMRDNPLSKIPTLVLEDGSALFDSVVICDYLNDLAGAALFPQSGEAKWQALRWHALADGLIDTLILWRNERERIEMQCSAALMDAFELKTIAALHLLEEEAGRVEAAPFAIGHVGIGCALGYLDFRFDTLGWRTHAPHLARVNEALQERPSFVATASVDG